MLGWRITQTITLSTVASVIVERYGAPLSRVAELSMIRSKIDGTLVI